MSLARAPRNTALVLILALAALVALTSGFLLTAPADALPADGTHVKVFDNCVDCNQIGYRHYDCEGNLTTSWGEQTGGCYDTKTYGCEPAF